MKKRFTEEKIIAILKGADASGNARDGCRRHNIYETTRYRRLRNFDGLKVPDAGVDRCAPERQAKRATRSGAY